MIEDNGVIAVWKPKKTKSSEIVRNIKSQYGFKTGHAGTLDPFAEGVLIICTGEKTKTVEDIHRLNKVYNAEIKLGEQTDTLDIDGEVVLVKKIPKDIKKRTAKVLKSFEGVVMQRPPCYSAVRVNNVRLYTLARKGVFINLKPRLVKIRKIRLKSLIDNILKIEVDCETGTYIRSLARDIGKALGTCAYLQSLIRTRIGSYDKSSCISL